eukprot:6696134-Prymnesium_polylepis.2
MPWRLDGGVAYLFLRQREVHGWPLAASRCGFIAQRKTAQAFRCTLLDYLAVLLRLQHLRRLTEQLLRRSTFHELKLRVIHQLLDRGLGAHEGLGLLAHTHGSVRIRVGSVT